MSGYATNRPSETFGGERKIKARTNTVPDVFPSSPLDSTSVGVLSKDSIEQPSVVLPMTFSSLLRQARRSLQPMPVLRVQEEGESASESLS
jgi:hypothetical protein